MGNKKPVQVLVFAQFRRRSQDEITWEHLVHQFVCELRKEVGAFYGNEGSDQEKQYPGFDYKDSKTRARLSRWPFHNKLFRAFEILNVTDGEIDSLVNWWGTVKEREEYERQVGHKIRDTTGDDIPTLEELLKLESAQVSESESDDDTTWNYPGHSDPDALKESDRQAFQSVIGTSIALDFHNLSQQVTSGRDNLR